MSTSHSTLVKRYLLICASLSLVLMISSWRASMQTVMPEFSVQSVTDITYIPDKNGGGTIYLADSLTKQIYRRSLAPSEKAHRFRRSEFQPLPESSELQQPIALAARDEKLLVCDKSSAVYEIDPATGKTRLVLKKSLNEWAAAMAVSAQGDIAIASRDANSVIWRTEKDGVRIVDFSFDRPKRLNFSGQNLLVLEEGGRLLSIEGVHLTTKLLPVPDKVNAEVPLPIDFGFASNVTYLVNGKGIFAYVNSNLKAYRDTELPLPVIYQNGTPYAPKQICVVGNEIFIVESGSNTILRMPRGVPMRLELNGNTTEATAALVTVYEHLSAQQILPVIVREAAADETVDQLLIEHNVLPSTLSKSSREIQLMAGGLICELNRQFCAESTARPERVWKNKLTAKQQLVVPSLRIARYLTSTVITLGDQSVAQYLRSVFPDANTRSDYIQEQLMRDNPPGIKESANRDILSEKGQFRLPVFRLKADILIESEQGETNAGKMLFEELARYRAYLFSRQQSLPRNAGTGVVVAAATDGALEVTGNRASLRRQIHFPDLPEKIGLETVTIGIAEEVRQVDFDHPDFVNSSQESIWFDLIPDGSDLPRRALTVNGSIPNVAIGDPFVDVDHGSHVAGLMAARGNGIAPGLISELKGLVLIDTTNSAALRELVQNAVRQGVFVFNFSFTQPVEAKILSLKTGINGQDWSDCIFIVAAGNASDFDSQDLQNSAEAPIKWIEGSRNMIGVGAVIVGDGSVSWMNPFLNESGETQEGSKYGKRFIQLVAPGKNIYSLGARNSYKKASGTSQAVPQVTAAAAILKAEKITTPARIKARLMYTSDWDVALNDKVYGGLLNVQRAVWEPGLDLVRTSDKPTLKKSINFDSNPDVKVVSGRLEFPDQPAADIVPGMKIKFNHIFRIMREPGEANHFRVFYFDEKTRKLRILSDAVLDGRIQCKAIRTWDDSTNTFGKWVIGNSKLELSDIFDYVADITKVPEFIGF
jgi:hypothetical protein